MTVPPSPSLRLRVPEDENEEIHGATVVYAVLVEYQQTQQSHHVPLRSLIRDLEVSVTVTVVQLQSMDTVAV